MYQYIIAYQVMYSVCTVAFVFLWEQLTIAALSPLSREMESKKKE